MFAPRRNDDPSLGAAWRTIHRDRGWWHKVLVGGALYLTIFGWPLAEGFHLASIENTQRGFPAPLPRWTDWGTKAITGLFGAIIDVFFFGLPLMIGGVLLLCGGLVGASFGQNGGRIVAIGVLVVVLTYELVVWLSGASIRSKLDYVQEGDVAHAMGVAWVRTGLRPATRAAQSALRLRSLVCYLLAVVLLLGALWLLQRNGWAGLVGLWLAAAALFYARLVTIQLYCAAPAGNERREFTW